MGHMIIVSACKGCNKIVEKSGFSFCKAYEKPWTRHRLCRCPLHSGKVVEDNQKSKKLNPIKASKRRS